MQPAASIAKVKVKGEEALVPVPISNGKPEIPDRVLEKWQGIVDLVAEILGVPTGLITRLTEKRLEIVVDSATKGNPYKRGDSDALGIGMFCETVAGKNKPMVVANTSSDEYWKKNPHAGFGMRAYLGVPIHWEDGELFGTFCMLDDKANAYSAKYRELLERFKEMIETDLAHILLLNELQSKLGANEILLREMHHRIKNQFNLLISFVSLKSRDAPESRFQETLKEIRDRVMALSLIHENLYKSEGLAVPSVEDYIPKLCSYILDDFSATAVRAEYELDDIRPSMDEEIAIGLMIAELVGNSLKHAFSSGVESPEVRIALRGARASEAVLEYRDNGKGLPPGFDPSKASSLGMQVLLGLANQMGGNLEAWSDGGAAFRITMKLRE
jgi:two-component sensor histidine kinase